MILKDKIILVTGSSGGMGNAIVEELKNESPNLIRHSNSHEIQQDEFSVKANFVDPANIAKMFEEIKEKFGKLDVLINTVGIEETNVDQLDTSKWQKMFAVNLFGVAECARHAIPLMIDGGVIVNISSIMGNTGIVGESSLAYSLTKASIQKLSENLGLLYAPKNIRVFSVSPGYTQTPIWSSFDSEVKQQAIDSVPIKRFIQPSEIAQFIISMIKNDAVTGINLTVAGGLNLKSII